MICLYQGRRVKIAVASELPREIMGEIGVVMKNDLYLPTVEVEGKQYVIARYFLSAAPEIVSCQELYEALKGLFPEIRLSWGYIGNYVSEKRDERSWKFFTKVPNSKAAYSPNCHSFGGWPTQDIPEGEEAMTKLRERMVKWIVETVLPDVAHVYRVFNLHVPPECSTLVERKLTEVGASFGMRGAGRFNFSIRHNTIHQVRDLVANAIPGQDIILKEEI